MTSNEDIEPYEKAMRKLDAAVFAFLSEQKAAGATQIALSQVKVVLNQMSGRPGSLAAHIVRRLVKAGQVVNFEPMGTDGIVYLT